ncbi:MAG: 16S rRNA (adenine(1518)-N(6)/adenine(1519)-N(6))-dimethyltransferase RsmA [Bacteroidota bacterium]
MPRPRPSSGSSSAGRIPSAPRSAGAASGVSAALRALDVRPSRRLGQNFLQDPRVADRIAALVEDELTEILEIGPGLGALTERLAGMGRRVTAVEVDLRLADALERRFSGNRTGVRVVRGDILSQRLEELLPGDAPVTVVANLPYSITTPALEWTLAQGPRVSRAFLMVQREVADRMAARPGTRDHGSLAVFLALHAEIEPLFRVSPGAFYPRPDVESVVVRVTPRPYPGTTGAERAEAERLARAATTGRRKTVANALAHGLGIEPAKARAMLLEAGVDPARRGETLSVPEWIALARTKTRGAER